MDSRFYGRLVDLLCLPQAMGMNYCLSLDVASADASHMQQLALTILQNLSALSPLCCVAACQQTDCLEVLLTLADLPDNPAFSRQVATTLLHFAQVPANAPCLSFATEKLLALIVRETACSRPLLQVLDRLAEIK